MTIWIALLLGLVQGLCEFLPVSSSGHLVLLNTLFGIEEGTLFFSIMLHLGTLIAVFAVYYKKIWALLRHPFQRQVGMLLIALIPTVAMALLFKDFFENAYGGSWLGIGFLLTACILLFAAKKRDGRKSAKTMGVGSALVIGAMQGVAILPGVSRSGSTIAGALFCGMSRREAADFSFLLSIPAILGSLVLELPDVVANGIGDISWVHILAGTAMAAVSGYFAIRVMLRVISAGKFRPFAFYVAVLGIFVLLDQFATHFFFQNPFA